MRRHAHLPLVATRGGTFWLQPCRTNTRSSAPAWQEKNNRLRAEIHSLFLELSQDKILENCTWNKVLRGPPQWVLFNYYRLKGIMIPVVQGSTGKFGLGPEFLWVTEWLANKSHHSDFSSYLEATINLLLTTYFTTPLIKMWIISTENESF